MPSPFPGMDPYLENAKLWPAFQHQLLACLYQILLPGLVDRYRARVGKLVTLLEVVSPANKTTPAGRQAYLDARQQALAQRAGVVEIDLVMQGKPTLNYSRDGLPEYDYAVTVTRSNAPDRYEIYTATLQKRLPKFKLPLAADDRDALLELQAAFARSYDLGTFAGQIDYKGPPPADVPLTAEHLSWVDALLKQMKLR